MAGLAGSSLNTVEYVQYKVHSCVDCTVQHAQGCGVYCIVHCTARFTILRRQKGRHIILGTVTSLPLLQYTTDSTVHFYIHCNVHCIV